MNTWYCLAGSQSIKFFLTGGLMGWEVATVEKRKLMTEEHSLVVLSYLALVRF
jgi:hypothetical protein